MNKVRPNHKKNASLKNIGGISLLEALQRAKGIKNTKRSKRRLSRAKNSLKLNRNKLFKKNKNASRRKSKKRSHSFGSEAGPGYSGPVSYSTASAPYFGKSEPYINPSEWFLPVTNGRVQRPEMLYKN